ncbi:MAG: TetR/AcrR family transcriptional regulator [Sebaldella sp.]|nr:TetR/AcrR family transcriptional regulator [Sebaldella sp.]
MNKDELYLELEKYFLEKGISDGSFKEFSEQKNISRTSLNYYFKNKDYIYNKILEKIIKAFEKDFNNLIEDETKSYSERIELFLDAYFKITRKNIKLYPYIQHLNQIEKNLKNKNAESVDEVIKTIKKISDKFVDVTNEEIKKGNIELEYPKNYLFLIVSICLFPFTTPYIIESVINISMDEFYEKHYEYMKYILLKEIKVKK